MLTPQPGGRVKNMWFSGKPERGYILEVRPYTGKYAAWFKWDVRVSAFNTKTGSLWCAVAEADILAANEPAILPAKT